jgi:hypothetical protein
LSVFSFTDETARQPGHSVSRKNRIDWLLDFWQNQGTLV